MKYPTTLNNLIECCKKFPGVGEKTAERMALSTLQMDDEILNLFSISLNEVKQKITHCKKCNNLSEGDLCEICKMKNRDESTICIVEEPKDIIVFEKMGSYKGLYHVLGGLISPLDGINPDDLNISTLMDRIEKEQIKEIIIAVKPSIEGETTSLYISKLLENKKIKITKIAHGIPIGVDMEYLDNLTLELAIENRTEVS